MNRAQNTRKAISDTKNYGSGEQNVLLFVLQLGISNENQAT